MFSFAHRPQTTADIVGNATQIRKITSWVTQFQRGSGMILAGPLGCGKTLALELIASELGYELYTLSGTDLALQMDALLHTAKQTSLFFPKKLIIIDHAERMSTTRGLAELVTTSVFPVIFVTHDPYHKKLFSLRKVCSMVAFHKPRYDSISKFLRAVCDKEQIAFDSRALDQLAKMANGDVRAALLDLESLGDPITLDAVSSLDGRTQEQDIFSTLNIIFKTQSLANADFAARSCEKTLQELGFWIHQNIFDVYSDLPTLSRALDHLSHADLFSSRLIKTHAWGLQKYLFTHLVHGVALSKSAPITQFTRFQPPRFFQKPANTSAVEKLAASFRMSKARCMKECTLIRSLLVTHPHLADTLGLSAQEKHFFTQGR